MKLDALLEKKAPLRWSPDGQRLAAAISDGTIQIWDATKGYLFTQTEGFQFELTHDRLRQARELYEAGRTEEAFALIEHILQGKMAATGYPRWVAAGILTCAEAARDTKHYDEAIAWYRILFRLNKANVFALSNLAYLLAATGRTEEALQTYRQAISLNPQDVGKLTSVAVMLAARGKVQEARGIYLDALRANPDDSRTLNNLAWILATCADGQFRDIPQALDLAQRADALNSSGTAQNTLGVVQYRAGDWHSAVTTLNKSMDLRNGGDSFDWFFLAMANRQLGRRDDARQWYDKAVTWMKRNKPDDDELIRFRKEAAELLGVSDEPKSNNPPSPKPEGN